MKEQTTLKEIVLKETYKVINKKVYAIVRETNNKREVDACEVRHLLNDELDELAKEKIELENKLVVLTNKMTEKTRLDNEIAALGYCKIDNPLYKRVDGIIVKDSLGNAIVDNYIHQNTCISKEV